MLESLSLLGCVCILVGKGIVSKKGSAPTLNERITAMTESPLCQLFETSVKDSEAAKSKNSPGAGHESAFYTTLATDVWTRACNDIRRVAADFPWMSGTSPNSSGTNQAAPVVTVRDFLAFASYMRCTIERVQMSVDKATQVGLGTRRTSVTFSGLNSVSQLPTDALTPKTAPPPIVTTSSKPLVSLQRKSVDSLAGGSVESPAPTPKAAVSAQPVTAQSSFAAGSDSDATRSGEEAGAAVTTKLCVQVDDAGFETFNNFAVIDQLGAGSHARVMLCYDTDTNEQYAFKMIPRGRMLETSKANDIMREVAIMKKLQHPNIVRLYECIDDPEAEMVYLVMQYIDNGPLLKFDEEMRCTPFPITAVQKIVKQLASAVAFVHAQGVVHCDIKPDNVLVDTKGSVYLTDFGVSELVDKAKERVEGQRGTPLFFSPDLLQSGHCTPASDMWALGVTIYAMVFGRLPFNGDSFLGAAHSILNDPLTFPPASAGQVKWTKLLRRLLERDPSKRMTAKELKHDTILRWSMEPSADDVDPFENVSIDLHTNTTEELETAVVQRIPTQYNMASGSFSPKATARRVTLRWPTLLQPMNHEASQASTPVAGYQVTPKSSFRPQQGRLAVQASQPPCAVKPALPEGDATPQQASLSIGIVVPPDPHLLVSCTQLNEFGGSTVGASAAEFSTTQIPNDSNSALPSCAARMPMPKADTHNSAVELNQLWTRRAALTTRNERNGR